MAAKEDSPKSCASRPPGHTHTQCSQCPQQLASQSQPTTDKRILYSWRRGEPAHCRTYRRICRRGPRPRHCTTRSPRQLFAQSAPPAAHPFSLSVLAVLCLAVECSAPDPEHRGVSSMSLESVPWSLGAFVLLFMFQLCILQVHRAFFRIRHSTSYYIHGTVRLCTRVVCSVLQGDRGRGGRTPPPAPRSPPTSRADRTPQC